MKTIKNIFFYIITFTQILLAQNEVKIYITPLFSTEKYNTEFNQMLNYNLKGIDKKSVKPELSFGFDFKPGIGIKLEYKNFSIESIFHINNSFTGPVPDAKQLMGNGKETYRFFPDGEGGYVNTQYKIKRYLHNRASQFRIGYRYKNLLLSINQSNRFIDILENGSESYSGIDTTNLDLSEELNSIGVEINYKIIKIKDFTFALNAARSYIYNFDISSFENYGSYEQIYNYIGSSWSLGTSIYWNNLFLDYNFLVIDENSLYFRNYSHRLTIGFNINVFNFDI